MAPRPPARTATIAATVYALLAACGLTACHDVTAPHDAAPREPATRTAVPTPTAPRSSEPIRHRRPSGAKPPSPRTTTTHEASVSPPVSHPPPGRAALPPVISRLPVQSKIVFITIDDGWEKDPSFVRLVHAWHIPLTLFLTNDAIKNDYEYFRALRSAGALIEDHTLTHPYMPKLSYARQKREICGPADIYAQEYGARPTLFRAPYGATNRDTLRAARDCGMRAVLFWREVVSGGRIAYQVPGRLHPGDILLVHFNPNMTADFERMLHSIYKQGFEPAPLDEYLPAPYRR